MVCNNICKQHKIKVILGESKYSKDQKRCNNCEVYLKWEGKFCPCCHRCLRTRPRSAKYRQQYRVESKLSQKSHNFEEPDLKN